MRVAGNIILRAVCSAVWLISTSAMAVERPPSSWPQLQLPLRLPFSRDGLGPQGSFVPHHDQLCRMSGARADRVENRTSDPCLAADSVPGGICFERLGEDPLSSASALLNLRDAHCEP
jgi:hypothetical protein